MNLINPNQRRMQEMGLAQQVLASLNVRLQTARALQDLAGPETRLKWQKEIRETTEAMEDVYAKAYPSSAAGTN